MRRAANDGSAERDLALEWWHAIVLGLVEGITEYLPISSTGHLILASSFMGLDDPARKQAVDAFNIVVQGGAILAVVGLYWPHVLKMLRGLLGKDAAGFSLFLKLIVAFLPAAVFGVLLDNAIEARLFYPVPVLAAVLVGGLFMMFVEAWRSGRVRMVPPRSCEKEIDDLTFIDALRIGMMQCVAMWPGTSRSMMTITGGYFAGLRPTAAAEFSFLLGLPTLGAATLYKLYKNFSHATPEHPNLFKVLGGAPVAIGILVAAASAAVAIKWLVGFLNRRGLAPFGWYRIGLFVVIAALVASGRVNIAPRGVDERSAGAIRAPSGPAAARPASDAPGHP